MQRSKNEETSLGRSERERNGFKIAHLAHKHGINVLSQRGFEPVGKCTRIAGHLTLCDDTAFVVVNKFDRFFDRYDVL